MNYFDKQQVIFAKGMLLCKTILINSKSDNGKKTHESY